MLLPRYYFAGEFIEFRDLFIKNAAKIAKYPAGYQILPSGEPLYKLIYFLEGKGEVSIISEFGKKSTIKFFGPNSIYPIRCDFDLFPLEYLITLTAMTDCRVAEVSVDVFNQMIEACPRPGITAIIHYCKYGNFLTYRSASFASENALTRTCDFLYLYGVYDTDCLDELPFSQDDIANVVGVSRIQITRIYSNLKDSGIIETTTKKTRLLDRKKLLDLCSEHCRTTW